MLSPISVAAGYPAPVTGALDASQRGGDPRKGERCTQQPRWNQPCQPVLGAQPANGAGPERWQPGASPRHQECGSQGQDATGRLIQAVTSAAAVGREPAVTAPSAGTPRSGRGQGNGP